MPASLGQTAQLSVHHIAPELHVRVQLVPVHPAVPFGSVAQGEQLVAPQLFVDAFDAQVPPHECDPLGQPHVCVLVLHSSPPVHCALDAQPLMHMPLDVSQYVKPVQPTTLQSVAGQHPDSHGM